MPANAEAKLLQSPFRHRHGEVPLTRFRPLEQAFKVEVVSQPSVEQIKAKTGPILAAHAEFPPTGDVELHRVLEGKGLWQTLETLEFDLLITGCTRIFTHQLVRARVGVTFSQQGTGDSDWRHHDVLLPSVFKSPELARIVKQHHLVDKLLYTQMVDDDGIAEQDARYILSHALETYIYVHGNLRALQGLYENRTCSMTQAWETKLFADRMREAVVTAAPWAAPLFKNPCEAGRCWYQRVKETPFACSHLWTPDKEHDSFEWNPASFAHGLHADEYRWPVEVTHHRGVDPITKEEWEHERHR